jgi:triacylglycerol lipase
MAAGAVWTCAMGGALGAPPIAHADGPAPYRSADGLEVPQTPGPEQRDHGQASLYSKRHPGSIPTGVNDFRCRPSGAHPRPVVLVHGTDSTAYADWAGVAPSLVRAGFCVFAPNVGGLPGKTTFGLDRIQVSARQVGEFVDEVVRATGVDKVDLVGFSLGATVTRYYVNRLGGARRVDTWVGLASPTYGGVMYGIVPVVEAIPGLADALQAVLPVSVLQQMQGSPLLNGLNAGGDTVPGVHYVTVGSRVDEMIQPYTNIALRSPGAVNVVLQNLCPADLSGHFNLVYDPFAQQVLLDELDPTHATAPKCVPVPLGTGILSVVLAAHGGD